ncbi:MAG: cation:proton antiporter [Mycobacterium sp.]|nr:cation:proton antiporter [Mycobacterium sp.]
MHYATPLVLAVLVLGYAVVSERVNRSAIAPALIFLLAGMGLGPFGLGFLDAGPGTEGYTVLAQLALTVILFNQAANLSFDRIRVHGSVTLRLLVIGIPLTVLLGALTAVVLLPVLPWWEAVCLAAIVAPTEAALIEALLDNRRIPERVRHTLSVESGFYDGFALAILLTALALASEQAARRDANWAWFMFSTEFLSLLAGGAVGLVGGVVVARSRRYHWMSDTWAQLATLALAFICFAVGERLEASGFVAAFTGGLAFSFVSRRKAEDALPTQVSDAAGQLLELLVFAMFGAFAVIDGWMRADWRVIVFAVLALFAVRVVTVLLSLVRTDLPIRERLFIGWFGPRGIGTVVLGLLVINRGEIQNTELIGTAVVVTVTLSLVLHSLTLAPGIQRLAVSAQ